MKKIISIAVVLIILGSTYGISRYLIASKPIPEKKAKVEKPLGVKTMKVNYSDNSEAITYTGRVTSRGIVQLGTEVSGRIIKGDVPLKEGQSFRKGQTLVRIFSDDIQQNIKASKSSFLTTLSTVLPDIKIDYPTEYDKWYTFFEAIDLNEELPALPKIATSKEKIFLSSSSLLTNYYSIRQQEINLQKYQIYAPFAGIFTSVTKEVGSIASVGATVGTIIQSDRMEIIVPVLPSEAMQIEKGDKAEVLLPNASTIIATVSRIGQFVDETTQMVNVYVSADTNSSILSGQYLEVTFAGKGMAGVVQVPREAVFEGNKMFKVVDRKLKKIEVNVVRTSDDKSYINAVSEDTVLVIESLVSAKDGMIVQVL